VLKSRGAIDSTAGVLVVDSSADDGVEVFFKDGFVDEYEVSYIGVSRFCERWEGKDKRLIWAT
jgi:hypothetical protein